MKTFVTFGSDHVHRVNNRTFDCDCVAVIHHGAKDEGRALAFDLFGGKFFTTTLEEHFTFESMRHYPRGFLDANDPILPRTCRCGSYLKDTDFYFCQECRNRQEESQYNQAGGF